MYLRLIQRDGRNGMSSSPSPPSSSWAWHLKTEIIPGGGLISLPSLFSGRRKQRKSRNKGIVLVSAAAATPISISNAETKDRLELKRLFREAYERCHASPTEGLSFTLQDFLAALDSYDFDPQIGSRVKGTVLSIDVSGALVDITAKLSPAYLPVEEVCIRRIKNVEEAGIFPGLTEEFVVIGSNEADNSLILSLRSIQYELAWERCRQLQAQDVVLNGKVVSLNHGGVVAVVEGLRGFVPVSQISTKATAEVLLGKTLPLKFVEVAEEQSRLVLSNRKAIASSQAHIVIGSVVIGTVQSLKPYGVFVDVCGINGLLHISQISHGYISDIATLLQPGDTLKVMILSHDREKGRVSLSTKNLEPIHGDMIRNPKFVFEKAEEMAEKFRQQLAQAEAMARAECLDSA